MTDMDEVESSMVDLNPEVHMLLAALLSWLLSKTPLLSHLITQDHVIHSTTRFLSLTQRILWNVSSFLTFLEEWSPALYLMSSWKSLRKSSVITCKPCSGWVLGGLGMLLPPNCTWLLPGEKAGKCPGGELCPYVRPEPPSARNLAALSLLELTMDSWARIDWAPKWI